MIYIVLNLIYEVLKYTYFKSRKLKHESLSLKMTIRKSNERMNSVMWKMIVHFGWRGLKDKDILEMDERVRKEGWMKYV